MLVPHFGQWTSRETLIDNAPVIEQMGFHSLWVRDHLVWKPHEMEGQDRTFLEPLLTLAALSAVTKKMMLGTAVLIPIRWPLKLAQNLATLSYLSEGRVMAGMGLGSNEAEFAAAGLDKDRRIPILEETLEICRRVWQEDSVSYQGEIFEFEDFTLRPKPAAPIPFLYGGSTRAAARRAVTLTEGWIPGRIPIDTLKDRLTYIQRLCREQQKEILLGTIPLVLADPDRRRARESIDIQALGVSSAGARHWVTPASGGFNTVDDLEGLLVAGDRSDCLRSIETFARLRLELVILDVRLGYSHYMQQLEWLAEWVISEFGD
ncbi:MAG: TIGR03619 family F420-dependent LLM class oxidoreductase [bacterium]|nr:TIGR03619 family F420-dependent LLM class oxidoreductase [Acidimicrobiia bacterium]MCY4650364.1 TIGR03619 family F420-dependent LLM class oxidoreductase [bacterium]